MKKQDFPKVVIFDLDGTLVDSAKHVASLLNNLRTQLGKPVLPVSSYVPWLSLGGVQLIQNGLEVSEADAPELLSQFRLDYKNKPTPLDSIFPYVKEVLVELSSRGVKRCICTNKPRVLAEKVLNELGLIKHFDYINAGGDLPKQKPHPDNLLTCLTATKHGPEDAILIGDSVVDQKLANVCGVAFGWYSAGNNDGVNVHQVDLVFEDFSQLINLLETRNLNRKVNCE